jgi:hypothetical protein
MIDQWTNDWQVQAVSPEMGMTRMIDQWSND